MESGRVLVVDDEAPIRELVTAILSFEGYPVESAANGEEALQVIERNPPVLVLLDMRMPKLDGWGFAFELRERGIKVPIVVMTAARDAQRWANEIKADGYIAKPFDLGQLLATVERHFAP